MTKRETILCNSIIHSASAGTAVVGAGLAQLPGSDNAIITPIQTSMIIALGKVFGISLSEISARTIFTEASAALVGRAISQALGGWLPVIGNTINAVTAASITEAIGWMVVSEFDSEEVK